MRVAAACTLLAAASLLVFKEATYDPTAWLIWGRQIAHGTLETTAGPSWKPLPVLFTTPFSLFGDTEAMKLWLVVARAGGIASIVLAYRVTARLAGRPAGAVAALALLLAAEYEFNWLRGNSEGLLVAFSLLALQAHLGTGSDPQPNTAHLGTGSDPQPNTAHFGRGSDPQPNTAHFGRGSDPQPNSRAFGWGVAAALLRPEVWPLLVLYGGWMVWRDRRAAWLVGGAGAAVALLWFVPEYIGSGDLLRAASRARESVPGSPGASDDPFLETFRHSAQVLSYGVYAGAVMSLAAWRDRRVAAIALASAGLMIIVAVMAIGGFTGNLRYVALPMALLCVLSGVGWAWLGRHAPAAVVAVAALAALPGLIEPVERVHDNLVRTRETDRFYGELPGFIERAGGREAVLECGPVFTGAYSTQAVAYRLNLREVQVGLHPVSPGTVIDGVRSRLGTGNREYTEKLRGTEWILRATC